MARVLHSPTFRARLSAIYLDEAHIPHESKTWRPAYTHLHLLRHVCDLKDIPMVALSATLPTVYRNSLVTLSVSVRQGTLEIRCLEVVGP
jgi:superfamily II DNA helicase RecQ